MNVNTLLKICFFFGILSALHFKANAQTAQWRLVQTSYSAVDPDGGGPATGVVQFQLQLRAASGSFVATDISTGFSWQSTRAMLPTTATCTTTPNIILSTEFTAAGYQYTTVNQCNAVTFSTGGQTFDRIASGSLDPGSGSINITTAWTPVFTVTLWALGVSAPEAGYAAIHSSGGGSPGPLGSYSIANNIGDEVTVNSLTFATPLPLGSGTLPVQLTKFDAQCLPNKSTVIIWATSAETNNSYFEVERSSDGTKWSSVGKVSVAGNSATQKSYQLNDPQGGAVQYRLKQVDRDGKTTYSSTVRTSCEGRSTYVTLFPVPARDVVTLVIGSDKLLKTNLQVFDNKGRMVVNMPVTLTEGQNSFKIAVHNLTAGEYILRGTNAGLEISKRFTVIR